MILLSRGTPRYLVCNFFFFFELLTILQLSHIQLTILALSVMEIPSKLLVQRHNSHSCIVFALFITYPLFPCQVLSGAL